LILQAAADVGDDEVQAYLDRVVLDGVPVTRRMTLLVEESHPIITVMVIAAVLLVLALWIVALR